MKSSQIKGKKHRHKWEETFYDCGLCGGGQVWECECGSVKEPEIINKMKAKFKGITLK